MCRHSAQSVQRCHSLHGLTCVGIGVPALEIRIAVLEYHRNDMTNKCNLRLFDFRRQIYFLALRHET
jgi:hypothetical protein